METALAGRSRDWYGRMETRRSATLTIGEPELTYRAGVTFFALISFPSTTPSAEATANPFDALLQSPRQAGPSLSPFAALQPANTDLCLSLESMKGRKYLHIRGVVDLGPDEELDGGEEPGSVQMWVSRNIARGVY